VSPGVPSGAVRTKGGELKITSLEAITREAEDAAERLYAMVPNVRITTCTAGPGSPTQVRPVLLGSRRGEMDPATSPG